jgi:ABC-type lipoprotein export system ATPase subunit
MVIELIDFTLSENRDGKELVWLNLSLHLGNVYAVSTDSATFLKTLATLLYPVRGTYRFKGETLDFSDYRLLLPIKKQIGYIGSDAAMISNMSIRDNLLLMRYYTENSLQLEIEGITEILCAQFHLTESLDMRPGALTPYTLRLAIATRELAKSPTLLLLEYPEDYIGQVHLDVLLNTLEKMPLFQMIVLIVSDNQQLIEKFTTKRISIIDGNLMMDIP